MTEITTKASDLTAAERVAESAHEKIDKVAEKAIQAEANIRQTVAVNKIKAEHHKDELTDSVLTYVNEKPLTSLGIAFIGGLLAASILRK